MSKLQDIIKEHGGSFDRVPNRASFWLPDEVVMTSRYTDFLAVMRGLGKSIQAVTRCKNVNGWSLFRFTGQRDTSCRTFRCFDVGATNNVNPHLTITVFKNGLVEIREKGRKQGVSTTVCGIYIQCLLGIVRRKNLEKARAKKAKKKARR